MTVMVRLVVCFLGVNGLDLLYNMLESLRIRCRIRRPIDLAIQRLARNGTNHGVGRSNVVHHVEYYPGDV
jgi:hypothetical protein